MKTLAMTLLAITLVAPAMAEEVRVDTFVRAESDYDIRANLATFEALGADVGGRVP